MKKKMETSLSNKIQVQNFPVEENIVEKTSMNTSQLLTHLEHQVEVMNQMTLRLQFMHKELRSLLRLTNG